MSSRLKELKTLFTSEARVRVLARLVLHTAQRFFQSEIAQAEELPVKAVQRELVKLARFGLVRRVGAQGRRPRYQANREHVLYPEVKAMVLKTLLFGTRPDRLKKAPLSKVSVAFACGSFARADEDSRSDIDLLVVGAIDPIEWSDVVRGQLPAEENSIVMPEEEFGRKMAAGDRFLTEIVSGAKIFLMGEQDELNRLVKRAKDSAARPDAR